MAPYDTSMRFPTVILVVNTVGLTLSFLALVCRIWARVIRKKRMGLSDYTIIASWVSEVAKLFDRTDNSV